MNEKNTHFFEDEEPIDLKKEVLKYLGYWPWFIVSVVLCVGSAFIYLRYADTIYASKAKIKILDEKENNDISLDVSKLFSKSSVNLKNEIAAFNSIRLAEKVVRQLDLDVSYLAYGNVATNRVYAPPFKIRPLFEIDSLREPVHFGITITREGYQIENEDKPLRALAGYEDHVFTIQELPLQIVTTDRAGIRSFEGQYFEIIITPMVDAALELSKLIEVSLEGKDSDILQLKMESTDKAHSRAVINTFIEEYAKDGVLDRQQVSRRTIAFVDERFNYLQLELDSVEVSKKNFKERNSLSIMEGDVQASIQKRVMQDNELKSVETQLLLVELLAEALDEQEGNGLLPADLGLNNIGVNQLVSQYNSLFLEFEKLGASAGKNNPSYKLMEDELSALRTNINLSINSYLKQLEKSRTQAQSRQEKAQGNFRDLPEKEQILRNIERQQNLKESLYLLLLQKREKAAINLAVIVPNIKVIDYAITEKYPVAPEKKLILFGALGLGLFIPFGVLYLRFVLDTKINSRDDIEKANLDIPLVGEIPFVGPKTIITDAMDRSVMSEVFRITASNIDYKLGKRDAKRGKVIFVTSSTKGEGKTFIALNLALSYAFLNKRVLLIGGDLRNPQIHKYFDLQTSEKGVSDYLTTPDIKWTDYISKPMSNAGSFDLMLAGSPSLNPTMILANDRFDTLIGSVVGHYDYVVVDTAPTLLVSDTQMIAKNADVTVHVLRAGMTDKAILEYARGLKKEEKLKNMTFVLNSVGKSSRYGYGYGYNYGYSYGYDEETAKATPWYKRWKK